MEDSEEETCHYWIGTEDLQLEEKRHKSELWFTAHAREKTKTTC